MIDTKLLEVIACPKCQGRLTYDKESQQFVCTYEKLSYRIENGIPVLLAEQAQPFSRITEESSCL